MATAHGPESAIGASPAHFMNSAAPHYAEHDGAGLGSFDPDCSRYDDAPQSNPPFVFPARPESPSSAPSSFSRATGRRPMSAIESPTGSFGLSTENDPGHHRPTALPAFSFNPGAALPPDPHSSMLLSPPITPNTPRTITSPSRPGGHGHRRGGSEFVGGSIRDGSSIAVMSTSPTKSESGFASPTFQPPRRGHRRGVSGAISTNDLPIILPPPDTMPPFVKCGSAPTSPTGYETHANASAFIMDDITKPAEPTLAREACEPSEKAQVDAIPEPDKSPKVQQRSGTRARVGFSDTLEFIPRPLSLVSSDASSTMTMRPGHAVSGSLSSIVPAASPTGRDSPPPMTRSPSRDTSDSRPSTAGAILERTQSSTTKSLDKSPRRRNSIPALMNVADDGPQSCDPLASAKASKRWSFFSFEALAGSGSPTKRRPTSSCSSDSTQRAASAGSMSDHSSESQSESVGEAAPKPKKSGKKDKKKKKKRKMKGWAGSILPRKAKSHGKRAKAPVVRPATPPAPVVSSDDEDEVVEDVNSEDLVTPSVVNVTEAPALPKPDASKRVAEDSSYQMIDLDAALGPFNTPLPHNPEWEAAQRAAGNVGKRRLHSAQGMKGFTGPGMHYHRRAESAPDLPPFDPGRSPLHPFGSSSTMDDVFEEEEEDEDKNNQAKSDTAKKQAESSSESDSDATPPARPVKESRPQSHDKATQTVRRSSSGLSDQSSTHSVRAERSRTSLHEDVIIEEPSSASFRNLNFYHGGQSSSSSLSTSPKRLPSKDLSPVDINPLYLPNPSVTPMSSSSINHASPYPSPRSPISVDAQRISTAPSSVADENNFQSLLMGEPGPEVRISADYDIPSLTSSTSATTRESFLPHPRIPPLMSREQRPVSVSSAFGRRRSSLVSLSRLISSSHGERSKLSMEVRLDNETDAKKHKGTKSKRLGRMMQFWKPHKESTPS